MTDATHIQSKTIFKGYAVGTKLQFQNDFVFIDLYAKEVLRFLIGKLELQLIAGHVTKRFDKDTKGIVLYHYSLFFHIMPFYLLNIGLFACIILCRS